MSRYYRSGTVNSKSFVGKDLLQIKWNFELTVYFKHEMIGKHFIETSNKVELRINHVQINRARTVVLTSSFVMVSKKKKGDTDFCSAGRVSDTLVFF